jgi:hypothetical protein
MSLDINYQRDISYQFILQVLCIFHRFLFHDHLIHFTSISLRYFCGKSLDLLSVFSLCCLLIKWQQYILSRMKNKSGVLDHFASRLFLMFILFLLIWDFNRYVRLTLTPVNPIMAVMIMSEMNFVFQLIWK